MIVFNMFAIPVVAVIALICWGLFAVLPEAWVTSEVEWIAIGIVSFVIGGVAELGGLKGRLFFLPIWFLGIAAVGIQGLGIVLGYLAPRYGYEDSWALAGAIGWWWLLAIPVGLAALAVLLWLLQVWLWRSAPGELENASEFARKPHRDQEENNEVWHAIGLAIFDPWWSYSQEVCAHNRKVTQLVLRGLDDQLNDDERRAIEAFDRALAPGGNSAEKIEIPDEITGPFKKLIELRTEGEQWFDGRVDGEY